MDVYLLFSQPNRSLLARITILKSLSRASFSSTIRNHVGVSALAWRLYCIFCMLFRFRSILWRNGWQAVMRLWRQHLSLDNSSVYTWISRTSSNACLSHHKGNSLRNHRMSTLTNTSMSFSLNWSACQLRRIGFYSYYRLSLDILDPVVSSWHRCDFFLPSPWRKFCSTVLHTNLCDIEQDHWRFVYTRHRNILCLNGL